ncbi:MAG: HAMP domain-containing histidine kinase [Nitrospirota bacterium]|nr:HAMP domain-containing histidine kinase [Nitrospirota bacterium]
MRLGLTHKIFGGYLAVMLLLGGIATYAGISLYKVMGTYSAFVEDAAPALRGLYSLEEVFRLQSGNEKKFYVVGSPDIARLFVEQNQEWEALVSEISRHTYTLEEREMLTRLSGMHKEYARRVAANFVMQLETGSLAETERLDTRESIENISRGMRNLSTAINDAQNARLEQARSDGGRTAQITAVLGLITVLVGLLAALGLSVYLTRPVRRLKAATEEVGQGLYGHRVPVASDDEIGDLAAAFNRMADRLESLDAVREEFIAYISHELKTPLTSMKEANSLLLDGVAGPLQPRQRQLLGIVQDGGLRIERLISELLDLSRMDAGMMTFFKEGNDFATVLSGAVAELQPVAEKRGIHLVTHPGPPAHVMVDHHRIRQALTNLISNAIKFSPEGAAVTLSWGIEGREAICSVADRGPGIPESAREVIFEKFHQLAPSALSGLRGAGLGLPIARRIVESHGGRVWVWCPKGGGSVFCLSLPLSGLHPGVTTSTTPLAAASTTGAGPIARAS